MGWRPSAADPLVGAHDAIPSAMSLAAATDRSRFRYLRVGPALVEQRGEVADTEVRVVRGFTAHLGAEAQVAAHQRRHGHPGGRFDGVEALAVDRHRPVRVHGVFRRGGVPAQHEIPDTADLAAPGSSESSTGTETQPVT